MVTWWPSTSVAIRKVVHMPSLLGEGWPLCSLVCCVFMTFPYVSWSPKELRVMLIPLNVFKPSTDFFNDRSNAVLLLWIAFVIYISRLSLLYCLVFSLHPCDHLLGKGWPLGFLVCDASLCFCHFPICCLGPDVVLDCIVYWSLPSSLLSRKFG